VVPSFVDEAIVKAKGLFFQETGQTPVPIPAYEKMQQQLSNVIYQQMSYRLTTQQTPFHTARLNSLKTPHATSWTSGFSPWYTLSNDAARHGMKWILGLSVNNASYKCNWCGKDADREGLHAVTCQLSGAIGRGHTVLKNVVYKIAVDAGLETELEAHLPNDPHNIPADVLVRNWLGRSPLALDFTIVSPALRYNSSDASESKTRLQKEKNAATRSYASEQGGTLHQLLQIHTGPFEQMAGLLFRRLFNDSRGKTGIRTEEK